MTMVMIHPWLQLITPPVNKVLYVGAGCAPPEPPLQLGEELPPVDLICGPGNKWLAAALTLALTRALARTQALVLTGWVTAAKRIPNPIHLRAGVTLTRSRSRSRSRTRTLGG